jgi:hypothetical protein
MRIRSIARLLVAGALVLAACDHLRPKDPGAGSGSRVENGATKKEPAGVMPSSDRYAGNGGVAQ